MYQQLPGERPSTDWGLPPGERAWLNFEYWPPGESLRLANPPPATGVEIAFLPSLPQAAGDFVPRTCDQR